DHDGPDPAQTAAHRSHRRGGSRGDVHAVDGRGSGAAPPVHRGQRAQRAQSRRLISATDETRMKHGWVADGAVKTSARPTNIGPSSCRLRIEEFINLCFIRVPSVAHSIYA